MINSICKKLLKTVAKSGLVQWSLINGDEKTGITVAYITSKLDSGDIILQREANVTDKDTGSSLSDRLSPLGAMLVMEGIDLIKTGNAPRLHQNETDVSYAPKIRHENALINWQQPARNIFNLVRALNAAPGAYAMAGDERLKILTTEIVDVCVPKELGTVVYLTRMGPIVCTHDRGLLLLEVQPQAKKPMSGGQFLQGQASSIILPFATLIALYIGAGCVWIPAKIVGGTGSYNDSLKVLAYSSALIIVTWIPFLGVVASIYQIVISVIGIKRVHGLTTGKAIFAVLFVGSLIWLWLLIFFRHLLFRQFIQ